MTMYRVDVEGGGRFLLDWIDVRRFMRRMLDEGDERPFTIRRESQLWTWLVSR